MINTVGIPQVYIDRVMELETFNNEEKPKTNHSVKVAI